MMSFRTRVKRARVVLSALVVRRNLLPLILSHTRMAAVHDLNVGWNTWDKVRSLWGRGSSNRGAFSALCLPIVFCRCIVKVYCWRLRVDKVIWRQDQEFVSVQPRCRYSVG